MNTNNNRKTIIWVIVIVVLIIILFMATRDTAPVTDTNGTGATSTLNGGTGQTGGTNGGTNTGSNSAGGNAAMGTTLVNNEAQLRSIIGNTAIRVPETGTDIGLAGGQGVTGTTTNRYQVSLGSILGKVETETGFDVYVDMTILKGTSPSKIKYVALYHVYQDRVNFKSSVSITPNVEFKSIVASADPSAALPNTNRTVMSSTEGYLATLTYLDRKNGEPVTTAPSVEKTLVLKSKAHVLGR